MEVTKKQVNYHLISSYLFHKWVDQKVSHLIIYVTNIMILSLNQTLLCIWFISYTKRKVNHTKI